VAARRPVREIREVTRPLLSPSDEKETPGAEWLFIQLTSGLTWLDYESQVPPFPSIKADPVIPSSHVFTIKHSRLSQFKVTELRTYAVLKSKKQLI
jgi:hypothetical protein